MTRLPIEGATPVRLDLADRIATITLDSPTNRNALSRALVAGLDDALRDVVDRAMAQPDDVRTVVLTHSPPAFCAGADLRERREGAPDSMPFVSVLRRIMDAPLPVVAAVKGPVRAGGIGLIAACDLVVVRSDVQFALTEVRLGLAAAVISVPILRRTGAAALAGAFLTGAPFDADEARRVGLVSHVADGDDGVNGVVAELCAGIALGSPGAVAATKRILREVPAMSRDEAFEAMGALSNELFASEDGAEGMRSFLEKSPPRWVT